ncbi:hypothetical protein L218DRAFT_936281 [Marasmius fiardii PR-910]|nr:hypothetical protein L218DRAFT_936281 [Marasmius fiardii PR-910]
MAITIETETLPTFNNPPLDGALSIPEVYDWHREHNPNHPIFLYSTDDNTRTISYSEFYDAYHRAGTIAANLCGIDITATREDCPVVGFLSTSDTITTFTNIVGLLRLGAVPFPISPRFSPRVVAHVLKSAGVSHVLVNSDEYLCSLVKDAVSLMSVDKDDENTVQICTLPEYNLLYGNSWYPRLPRKIYDRSTPAIIIHSSSSTSDFPKVVPWTIGMQMQHSLIPTSANQCAYKLSGAVISCHSIELFHTFGLLFLYWTVRLEFGYPCNH